MMKSWITAQPKGEEDDVESRLDMASCLLEAAKQLRWGSESEIMESVLEFVAFAYIIIFTFNGNRKHLEFEVKILPV